MEYLQSLASHLSKVIAVRKKCPLAEIRESNSRQGLSSSANSERQVLVLGTSTSATNHQGHSEAVTPRRCLRNCPVRLHSEPEAASSLTVDFSSPSFFFFFHPAAQTRKVPGGHYWQAVFEQEYGPDHEQTRQARPTARCKHRRTDARGEPDSHASTSVCNARRCDGPTAPNIYGMLYVVPGEESNPSSVVCP